MSKYSREIDLSDSNAADTKIIHLVGKNKKVLEFGCAGGHMSKVLKEKCGCEVVGIEINAEDADMARAYCNEVVVGDIEDLAWCKVLAGKKFDVAMFADVLEHLKRPERPLGKVREFLKDNGCVLVSVPNIANVSIRLELLSGSFEYEDLGILDDTHLKYFTLKRIVNLIESAKLYVDLVDYSTKDLPDQIISDQLKPLGLRATKKTLENFSALDAVAYEFILKAHKRKPKAYVPYKFREMKKPQRIMEEVFQEGAKQNREKNKHIENLKARLSDQKKHIKTLESERGDRLEHILNLESELADRRRHIDNLEAERGDRLEHILNLEAELADRKEHIGNLEAELSDGKVHISNLEAERIDHKQHIENLEAERADRREHISNLEALQVDRDQHIANLEKMAIDREKHLSAVVTELNKKIADVSGLEKDLLDRERYIKGLEGASARLEEGIEGLKAELDEKLGHIAELEGKGAEREHELEMLKTQIDELEKEKRDLSEQINKILASVSWRTTKPLRAISDISIRGWKSTKSFWKS